MNITTESGGSAFVSTAWVAKRLGVPSRTIQNRVRAGKLPYVAKLDGRTGAYLFDPAVIEEIANGQVAA
jgi:predicted site-specific integrase-resolvase